MLFDSGKLKAITEFVQLIPAKSANPKPEKCSVKELGEKYMKDFLGYIDGSSLLTNGDIFGEAYYMLVEYLTDEDNVILKTMYRDLDYIKANEGDEEEMMKFFLVFIYFCHIRQPKETTTRNKRLSWQTIVHVEHMIAYMNDIQNWDPIGYWKVLEFPLEDYKNDEGSKAIEKLKNTPKKTPFRSSDNFGLSDSISMDSPTTRVLQSPRIRERMLMEINKQVQQKNDEYFEAMKNEFDSLQRENERLIHENKVLEEKMSNNKRPVQPSVCDDFCESKKELSKLQLVLNINKNRLTTQTEDMESMRSTIDQKDLLIAKLNGQITNMKFQLVEASQKQVHADDYDKTKAESDSWKQKFFEETSKVDVLENHIKTLSEKIQKYKSEIAALSNKEPEIKKVLVEVEKVVEVEKIVEKEKVIEVQNGPSQEEFEELQQQNRSLKSELDSIKENFKNTIAKMDNMKNDLEEKEKLKEDMELLQKELKNNKTEFNNLIDNFNINVEKQKNLEKELITKMNEIEDLRLVIGDLQSEIKELEHLKSSKTTKETPLPSDFQRSKNNEWAKPCLEDDHLLTYTRQHGKDKYDAEMVSKERLKELFKRNEKTLPHMQSHYITELQNTTHSPSSVIPKKRI